MAEKLSNHNRTAEFREQVFRLGYGEEIIAGLRTVQKVINHEGRVVFRCYECKDEVWTCVDEVKYNHQAVNFLLRGEQ